MLATESQTDSAQTSRHATTAAVLRCLAYAPRLPGGPDWGTLVLQILHAATPQSSEASDSAAANLEDGQTVSSEGNDASLAAACILLALKHGNVATHGLGELLDELMTQRRFAQLPSQLQCMLLVGLPEVLQSLSSHRAAAVTGTLSMLGSNSHSWRSCQLSTAAWVGLARVMHNGSNPDSAKTPPLTLVMEAVYKAVQQLLRKLPLPPFLLPGEPLPPPNMDLDLALSGVTDAAATAAGDAKGQGMLEGAEQSRQERDQDESQRRGAEGVPAHLAWGAACTCLQMMPTDKVRPKHNAAEMLQDPCLHFQHTINNFSHAQPCSCSITILFATTSRIKIIHKIIYVKLY